MTSLPASSTHGTSDAGPAPVLAIKHLNLGIRQADHTVRRVVDNFSLAMGAGEIVGLVGESGSGKTMIGRAVLQLLPPVALTDGGSIEIDGKPLPKAGTRQIRALRGRDVGMVFQEPMVSLNPALTVGKQMTEGLRLHHGLSARAARERCMAMLERVHIAEPSSCFTAYPHQFSGGMRQRIMLAAVLVMGPRLLIADEPTTALDSIIQTEVMDIMVSLTRELGTALLLISHDLALVAHYASRVVVLRQGQTMEAGQTASILLAPQHEYTRSLLESMPARLDRVPERSRKVLLEASGLCVNFAKKPLLFWRKPTTFCALNHINLRVREGETLAVVGESGSGKTTLGRTLVQLVHKNAGSIRFNGEDIDGLSSQGLKRYRLQTQMVFQDPFSSLDPRMCLLDIVAEGLRGLANLNAAERRKRALFMLAEAGLSGEYAERLPHELSGGQRQRVCIARAIVAEPRFIVADEPVSALDVTVQKQILLLMMALQRKFGFSYIFISHDLGVVEQVADRVMVMYRGRVLEAGSRDAIFDNPRHPYTRRLLRATPRLARTPQGSYHLVEHQSEEVQPPPGYHYFNHGSMVGTDISVGSPALISVGIDHEVACATA